MHLDGQTPAIADDFSPRFAALTAEVRRTVYGKAEVVEKAVICLLAGGHLLLDDRPGVGKTTLAKALAGLLAGGTVNRIQGTPDLLPSDIIGTSVYERGRDDFTFRAGPVIANIVLFDEINRCSPRTQSALLEAMQERRVTAFRHEQDLPEFFMVIGTQNPLESLGTYPLPEAQLDRFLMRLSLGYPDRQAARALLKTHGRPDAAPPDRPEDAASAWPVSVFREMARQAAALPVSDAVYDYLLAVVEATRTHPAVVLGASPRASVDLLRAARVSALVRRPAGTPEQPAHLRPEDVRDVAADVLAHRLMLTGPGGAPEQRAIVESILGTVPTGQVPVTRPRNARR
ncbi:MoxR-like ATPase [Actinoplanes sp. SE50]|uniref:AAA family ATPase n=1 Tax=unclassified Actinoplanes TaxID=2626549 RepID=UPI00023EC428|nr:MULTISPECIES: MoxR family ATPase [unclassified Actinoplanes]AEV83584.1 MoxR-like ATPase [Actinoplanes sp. SE50/110]ATO82272.1 MoxR-like ATPase [Actinoplanes sp. SE50]SLL99679.1 MoxR-like ATPase [Actinoplanes sp. SE50/110]